MVQEHGVTINPIAFLVIQSNNVKLMPVNHSSSIDKLLDYVPDLIEKTNSMMNKIMNNKKEETEKVIKEMQRRNNIKKENIQEQIEVEYDETMKDEEKISFEDD